MGCRPCAEKRAALMRAARKGDLRVAASHAVDGARMMAAKVMQSPAVTAQQAKITGALSRDSTRLHETDTTSNE